MLLFGVLYLGQYQKSIIETKLENFEREVKIIAIAMSEIEWDDPTSSTKIGYLIGGKEQEIKIFENNARLVFKQKSEFIETNRKRDLRSIKMLKDTASFVIDLLPDTEKIPKYPTSETPGVAEALNGFVSLSAWINDKDEIILSASAPLFSNQTQQGALTIVRQGDDIKDEIGKVWQAVLRIFIATLLITLILSIYLAGAIANPLKKLAKAAEAVRTGRATGNDIPDFSQRYDEIGDLSLVLRSMTDALWAKMDSIESFAADVAHELKNPLTSLRSAIETLEKVKKKSDREKLLEIIEHDIARMDRLITDISSASRLDAELSRETFEPIKIDSLMIGLLDSYKNPIHRQSTDALNITTAQGVHVSIKTNDNHNLTIKGSKGRLLQVFQNLIDNALSFSKEGDNIRVTINQGENLVAIHVDDEGIGIPEKKLETIFERFYTERPSEAYGQNSGLGLSICKQIIESHRGEIFAENRHNDAGDIIGARFSVVLKGAKNG